jgi:uncharacterized membrane protein
MESSAIIPASAPVEAQIVQLVTASHATPDRLESVDLLRGVVMIIMALDHVRDFFSERIFLDPTDLSTTTPGIFLTRWITHYCAPTFLFLAGAAAFLSGTRGKTTRELSWFLFSRGLWLAFLEVTINRFLWMSNFDIMHHGAGVFWAIGWSMVLLSVLVYLPTWAVTTIGLALIVLHNSFDFWRADQVHLPSWLWVILHSPGEATVAGNVTFGTGYCLLPWMGVMAAGYGFGALLQLRPLERLQQIYPLGLAVTLGFIVFRAMNNYGDPRPWELQSTTLFTFFSFLNCTKYPASLLYLMMTLGPAILFLGVFDRPLGRLARPIITFGRVPLFFYLMHILLIHAGVILCDYLRFGWSPQLGHGPWDVKREAVSPSYGLSLPMVYLVWVGLILVLYWPCRWYAGVKRRHPGGLLSYL